MARRLAGVAAFFLVGIIAGSCALFQDEDSLSPSPTITIPTTVSAAPVTSTTTTAAPTSTAPPPTSTTTTTAAPATPPGHLRYLEQLLSAEVDFAALADQVRTINENWENRSVSDISFSLTESAFEDLVEQALSLREEFDLIEPAPDPQLQQEHRIAAGAVQIMADTPSQMLEGLRSTDTGQSRRTALVGFLTAFELLEEVVARVAAGMGVQGELLLSTGRSVAAPTVTAVDQTTSTAAPDSPPPNPGNTKNCSDFSTQAEAQRWFDTYYPHYGDVAQIDTNANLVACEALLESEPEDSG